ncbi:papain family cysteine protease domain-containing protein [Ditylenchus destructor]|uniref:Papain family cysteine protease domain-containing protein n=1 Tax=Ditylenchus destructor TaxID=166010 RepID=A0AAD4NAS9_9BILA|nr:papain family cysteine protease domain-containing protein [Ditylenchus destructor]
MNELFFKLKNLPFFLIYIKFLQSDLITDTLGQADSSPPESWNPSTNKSNNADESSNFSQRERVFAFLSSKKLVEDHNKKFNAGLVSFQMALNHLADVPRSYIRMRNNYRVESNKTKIDGMPRIMNTQNPLTTLDQRKKRETPDSSDYMRYMSPIRNQGNCGSCWAISAAAALESHYQMALEIESIQLSPQQLLDCAIDHDGCQGASVKKAFRYAKRNNGIEDETSYPYMALSEDCRVDSTDNWRNVRISNIKKLHDMDENDLKDTLAEVGPIVVAIDANAPSFSLYSGGVYYDPECTDDVNHAMLLVGYGSDQYGDYWLIKNSWGIAWGEEGYLRLARNRDNHCGVAVECSYPVIVSDYRMASSIEGETDIGGNDGVFPIGGIEEGEDGSARHEFDSRTDDDDVNADADDSVDDLDDVITQGKREIHLLAADTENVNDRDYTDVDDESDASSDEDKEIDA